MIVEDVLDAPAMLGGDPDAAAAAEDPAEALTRLAHRGRVDDGEELFHVVEDRAVVEHLVAPGERLEPDVALEAILLPADGGVSALHLHLDGAHRGRQEPRDGESVALLVGERRPSIDEAVVQHVAPPRRDVQELAAVFVPFEHVGRDATSDQKRSTRARSVS